MKIELPKFPSLPVPALFDAAIRLLVVVFMLSSIILASRWLTELTAPRLVASLPSATLAQPETGSKMIGRLFGFGEMRAQAVEGLRLTGVFVGSNGGGFATFHTRTGEVSAFPGDEVAPGVKLKQIERDRVILLASGTQRELRLQQDNVAAATASTHSAPSRGQPAASPAKAQEE